jgi:hypothetical protein
LSAGYPGRSPGCAKKERKGRKKEKGKKEGNGKEEQVPFEVLCMLFVRFSHETRYPGLKSRISGIRD